MMSDQLARTAPDDAPARGPAPLSTGSAITTLGTLAWLGWLWGLAALASAVALTAIAVWGSMTQSLWINTYAGWQRWPLAGAGFTMIATFLPLFATNGATRRRLAQSAMVTAVVLAVAGAVVITVGYALEALLYRAEGWTHAVSEGGRTIGSVGYPALLTMYSVTLAAYFVGGWLVAVGVYRLGWWGLVPGLAAGFALVILVEYLVAVDAAVTQFDVLDRVDGPPLALGAVLAIATTALAAALAGRLTRSIDVE
jgi:hypothetical protein